MGKSCDAVSGETFNLASGFIRWKIMGGIIALDPNSEVLVADTLGFASPPKIVALP